ncbi:alcohol dehydrogenase family protein [Pseudomonas sp. A-R-19]|uniref:alcohol dehydrogenase family protein n=1 Tax=Pseudomonas sp. A-R-19 TaxID=2832403 RepID=UPI001CBDC463|nr:alcohol dehydrogenase family protein [Pseudomonas sp. A-R-19]
MTSLQAGTASESKTMRGVHLTGYGGVEKLVHREDIPVPELKAGEVLIKVGACGMNNTDINLRSGWYDRDVNTSLSEDVGLKGSDKHSSNERPDAANSWNQKSVLFPRIQGAAVVGSIVAVSSAEDSGRVGQRVIVDPQVRDFSLPLRAQLVEYLGGDRDGGFAEYVAVPGPNAYQINSTLSDAELATFPTSYDTAEEMLVRVRLAKDEVVVITGAAGGVGTALIQLALIRGAVVIAIAGKDKEQQLLDLGARHFIARDDGSVGAKIEAIVGSKGIDVFVDVVGGPLFGEILKKLTRGGRYATAGAIAGPIQPFDLRDLIYKDLEMYGITCPTPETFASVLTYIEQGRLKPILAKSFSLHELPDAQAELVKRSHVGKFVVVP